MSEPKEEPLTKEEREALMRMYAVTLAEDPAKFDGCSREGLCSDQRYAAGIAVRYEATIVALEKRRDSTLHDRPRIAQYEEVFRWLLGEEGEFPESQPGKRYNFRSELRLRLAAIHTIS